MFSSCANPFVATALFAAGGGVQVGDGDEETAVTLSRFGTAETVHTYSALDRNYHFFQMLGVNQRTGETYRAVGNSGQRSSYPSN